VAVRDKSRAPRSGDFVRQSPGVQGAAAIGAPCALLAPVAICGLAHERSATR
ncbi:hypothetical protein Q460_26495, partial [Escherichia coli ATCC BAA-2219]